MITYASSGVNIAAGDETVSRIKPLVRSTFTSAVLTDIGLFGGLYDARFPEYEHPVLVSSTDGVGTKLKVAFMTDKHSTVGHCLVNHCTNDILACGAKPLFFLDYFATGKLDPNVAEEVVTGLVSGCLENNCALIGGETAEMPSMYSEGEYDIAGTIVGIVDKSKVLSPSNVKVGNVLIGLPSSGLHTNGYSLARAALFPTFSHDTYFDDLGSTLGDALLAIHRSYLSVITPMLELNLINALSHITGGGIIGNTKRILPAGTSLEINWNSWQIPALFNIIQRTGNIADEEMREAFNLGIGIIMCVDPVNVDTVMRLCKAENPVILGRIHVG
ncbi:MAG: phosphoribosylformylglycinamidine cyclo-ligase [Ignavibacteria bacterium]|nr:phosphoribosylformylglycinamidine cyclo-ligase [Ignavibacteria bacterium]